MRNDQLWILALVLASISLSSVGGGSSTLAALQHQSVEVHHWITGREFIELFAISRASPGPGSMLSTLIGWKVGGWFGAIIATLAIYVPSSLLCFAIARQWNKYRDRAWHAALREGLAPIGAGLTLAAVLAVARVSGAGVLAWGVAAGSALFLGLRPNLHPLVLLVLGVLVFLCAWKLNA